PAAARWRKWPISPTPTSPPASPSSCPNPNQNRRRPRSPPAFSAAFAADPERAGTCAPATRLAPRDRGGENACMIDSTRYPRLSRIDSPADLRGFDETELPEIADELRAYLIESVGRSGGHFGAGLGVIELTTALHWLYDTPDDR